LPDGVSQSAFRATATSHAGNESLTPHAVNAKEEFTYFYCVMNGYGQLSGGALSDSMDIA